MNYLDSLITCQRVAGGLVHDDCTQDSAFAIGRKLAEYRHGRSLSGSVRDSNYIISRGEDRPESCWSANPHALGSGLAVDSTATLKVDHMESAAWRCTTWTGSCSDNGGGTRLCRTDHGSLTTYKMNANAVTEINVLDISSSDLCRIYWWIFGNQEGCTVLRSSAGFRSETEAAVWAAFGNQGGL